MAGDLRREFNTAVRECLANCYRTDLPVAALAEYVEVLKRRDWTPAEIHRVEAAVTKILLAVVSKNERDDLVNRIIQPRENRPATTGDSSDSMSNSNPAAAGQASRRCNEPDTKSGPGSVLPSFDPFGPGSGAARRS